MKNKRLHRTLRGFGQVSLATLILGIMVVWATRSPAADAPTNDVKSPAAAEAAYTRTIEKRAADIVAALEVKAPADAAEVRELLVLQYRSLRDWHDRNDAKLKGAAPDQIREISVSLKSLHDHFIAVLSTRLSPAQVELVKDKMTYNKVKVTYDAYCAMVPNLTEEQKQRILALLKEAREEAMDAGSSDEKNKIFRKFKGRINNYLAGQGHDAKEVDKAVSEKEMKGAASGASSK